jgi:hypothetical protein
MNFSVEYVLLLFGYSFYAVVISAGLLFAGFIQFLELYWDFTGIPEAP